MRAHPGALPGHEIFDEPALHAMIAGREAAPLRVPTPYWKDYDSYPELPE